MRILANENFPATLVGMLRERGHDVAWIKELGPGMKDSEVLRRAQSEKRVVATLDKDFGSLAFRSEMPADCGVLLLRIRGVDPESFCSRAITEIESRSDWSGVYAVIDDDRIRIRSLPSAPTGEQ